MTGPVVVTGASGFIGRALVAELARRRRNVMAVARGAQSAQAGVETIQVGNYAKTPIPRGATVVHLAETRDLAVAERTGGGYVSGCVASVERLLAGAPARFMYVSSAAVYGDEALHPRRPQEKPSVSGVYTQAKVACEELVLAAGGVVARLANVYGSGMANNSVVSEILSQLHGRGPLLIRDGRAVRDFLWIEDAARGLADLAQGAPPGIFNLGSGRGIAVVELAKLALKAAGQKDREVREIAPSPKASTLVLDIEDTVTAVGWKPEISLSEGLARLLKETR